MPIFYVLGLNLICHSLFLSSPLSFFFKQTHPASPNLIGVALALCRPPASPRLNHLLEKISPPRCFPLGCNLLARRSLREVWAKTSCYGNLPTTNWNEVIDSFYPRVSLASVCLPPHLSVSVRRPVSTCLSLPSSVWTSVCLSVRPFLSIPVCVCPCLVSVIFICFFCIDPYLFASVCLSMNEWLLHLYISVSLSLSL